MVLKRLCQRNNTHSTCKKFLCCYQFMGKKHGKPFTKIFSILSKHFKIHLSHSQNIKGKQLKGNLEFEIHRKMRCPKLDNFACLLLFVKPARQLFIDQNDATNKLNKINMMDGFHSSSSSIHIQYPCPSDLIHSDCHLNFMIVNYYLQHQHGEL